jgi:hypothetical protein
MALMGVQLHDTPQTGFNYWLGAEALRCPGSRLAGNMQCNYISWQRERTQLSLLPAVSTAWGNSGPGAPMPLVIVPWRHPRINRPIILISHM